MTDRWLTVFPSHFTALNKAIELATVTHDGQTYGDGPYMLHVKRVADHFTGVEEVAAYLHDVVEDSRRFGVDSIRNVLIEEIEIEFGAKVAEIVWHLTRSPCETYREYIRRCANNDSARRIKIADLRDNLNGIESAFTEDKARSMAKRYRWALNALGEAE